MHAYVFSFGIVNILCIYSDVRFPEYLMVVDKLKAIASKEKKAYPLQDVCLCTCNFSYAQPLRLCIHSMCLHLVCCLCEVVTEASGQLQP